MNDASLTLRRDIAKCWNVGALSPEASRVSVTILVLLTPDGKPHGDITLLRSSQGSDADVQAAFKMARRAVVSCGQDGFRLPVDLYDQWKELELKFENGGLFLS